MDRRISAARCANMCALMTSCDDTDTPRVAALRSALVFGFLLFVIVVIRTAWLGDDAYITFRSIDNLLHGYGFRWNVVERVQPFTHPLWALALIGPFALTGEAYFSSLAVSMLLAFAAVAIFVVRVAGSQRAALIGLAVFVFSKAFVEYSTSGLENPLTTFLLVMFLDTVFGRAPSRLEWLWLWGGLLLLNRLDLGLLVLPTLAVESVDSRRARSIRAAAVGLAPLVAWEAFSLVYYGFLLPNTAYAKLQTGVATGELLAQGGLYLLDSLSADPVTLTVMAAAVVLCLSERKRRVADWPLAAGVILYLVYVVRVGGDFMSGRFLVAPLVLATALLCRVDWDAQAPAVPMLVTTMALLGTFATVRPPITSTIETFATSDAAGMGVGGVADERAFYYRMSGLLRWTRENPLPADPLMVADGKRLRGSGEILVTRNIGFFGYFAGPTVHIVDLMALSDPLLARQPAVRPWRIGHFERRVPAGYVESIRSGTNGMADYETAVLYDRLKLVTQGPIWSAKRWRAIRRLHLGW